MPPFDLEPQNLATTLAAVAQTPMLALLFWMMHGLRRHLHDRPEEAAPPPDAGALSRTRDELAAFKLEVARTYVPLSLIRDVDQRLSRQLLRIEEKLDAVARAATAAQALQAAQPMRGWHSEDRS
ncbi:hypothetical protein [Roseomonas sp. 18066]|uniref:hypothetical protein n=1 Tax=Roseomonas sp. 18066 TaxID=2681412 RepID=UPI001358AC30|nr:hypothetical protein [Roseomonas sp. 18066]